MAYGKLEVDAFLEGQEQRRKASAREAAAIQESIDAFIKQLVTPAFNEIEQALRAQGRSVAVRSGSNSAAIRVMFNDRLEIEYGIEVTDKGAPIPQISTFDPSEGRRLRTEGTLRMGAQDYTFESVTRDEVIAHFLEQYQGHLEYLESLKE